MINPRQKVKTPSHTQLVRDLTLTGQAPIAFCVRFLLQQLDWTGRQERLFELFGNDPREMDAVDARNLMLRLGFTSTQENLQSWEQLETHNLPALYIDPERQAYVLINGEKDEIIAANTDGRHDLNTLKTGGSLILFQEASTTDRSTMLQKVLYRFRDRLTLLYAISFVIALLALVVPFYIRAVYNLVIPSENGFTGAGLYIGVVLLFFADWLLRQWRSRELASLAARIDALVGLRLMEKTLELDSNQVSVLGPRNFQTKTQSRFPAGVSARSIGTSTA